MRPEKEYGFFESDRLRVQSNLLSMAVLNDLEPTDASRSTASTQGFTAAIALEMIAIVARVFSCGIAALAASTASIVLSVGGDGRWAVLTAVSNSLQLRIIFPSGPAVASAARVGPVVRASSSSAFEAAPTKSATASRTSLIALAASIGSGPKSIRMDRIRTSHLEKVGGVAPKGTKRIAPARSCAPLSRPQPLARAGGGRDAGPGSN